MSTQDVQIVIRHLLVAFGAIALLVAGPFLWANLTTSPGVDTQQLAQLPTGLGLPSP